MDIKLTHSLLTQYLDTKATPEQVAEALSLCGPTVDRLTKLKDDDYLYEIEIITNRVDAASAYGVAREAAAILPEFGHPAHLRHINTDPIIKLISDPKLKKIDLEVINDPKLNPRILAIKISNVTIKPSPKWLQNALMKLDQRPLNNIIDITNFVMFELGHPVHAFDYDRLTTKKIVVREARAGDQVTTLDDKTHSMKGGEIVYDNGTGEIVDLPGIMGTANSVITDHTKNVLLWIEDNDGKRIRKASLTHQIRTNAAILNEKQVDPELAYPAILRAAELMVKLGQGEVGSQLLDLYPNPKAKHSVELNLEWLNRFSGIDIKKDHVIAILERLGFRCDATSNTNVLSCLAPSWRSHDIRIREDLAEEIVRVHGYYKLPSIIPKTDLPKIPTDPYLTLEFKIRQLLATLGATEIYNYSLVSDKLIGGAKESAFKLVNPLSENYLYMRQSLLPSLLMAREANRGSFDQSYALFEIANVYTKAKKGSLANETPHLAIVWNQTDFRHAKGLVEALSAQLHLARSLELIPMQDTFGLECSLLELSSLVDLTHHFKAIPETPAVIEDLTFTVTNMSYQELVGLIREVNPLIESIALKDIYQQNYTFTITYRSSDRTLSNEEITPIRKQIVAKLAKQNIELVGKLI